jgi:hypothetical protein
MFPLSMLTLSTRAGEPMACMLEVSHEKILLAHSIHCCPNFFPDQPSFFEEYVYFCEGTEIVYDYHHYQIMP